MKDTVASRVRRVTGAFPEAASDDQLREWMVGRWDHFASKGPSWIVPNRRAHVERPWPEKSLELYAAQFPLTTASNLTDFQIYAWFSSSIQQDVIRDGAADMTSFFPEERGEGVGRLLTYLSQCEVLSDHDSIMARLKSLRLPAEVDWLLDMKFKAAFVSAGPDGIDLVAECSNCYVILFAVDG